MNFNDQINEVFEIIDIIYNKDKSKRFIILKENENMYSYKIQFLMKIDGETIWSSPCCSMSHSIYVPIQTEYYAMEGVTQLLQTIEMGRNLLMNKELTLKGVFATMYDNRRNLDKAALEKITEFFGDKLMNTKIRRNIKLAEAPARHESIFVYDPASNGAKDYINLTKEIIAREENNDNE